MRCPIKVVRRGIQRVWLLIRGKHRLQAQRLNRGMVDNLINLWIKIMEEIIMKLPEDLKISQIKYKISLRIFMVIKSMNSRPRLCKFNNSSKISYCDRLKTCRICKIWIKCNNNSYWANKWLTRRSIKAEMVNPKMQ